MIPGDALVAVNGVAVKGTALHGTARHYTALHCKVSFFLRPPPPKIYADNCAIPLSMMALHRGCTKGKSHEGVIKMLVSAREAGPSFTVQVLRRGAAHYPTGV